VGWEREKVLSGRFYAPLHKKTTVYQFSKEKEVRRSKSNEKKRWEIRTENKMEIGVLTERTLSKWSKN